MSKLDDAVQDLSAAIELARYVAADYQKYRSRIAKLYASAGDEAEAWREKVLIAAAAGAPDLAAKADERARDWERREQEAGAESEACDEGLRRLGDALTQLQALAKRTSIR